MTPAPRPDADAFVQTLTGGRVPTRVHHIELFLDPEVQDAVAARFDLDAMLDRNAADFSFRRQIAIQRALGYDYVRVGVDPFEMPMARHVVADTADLTRSRGRSFVDNVAGPITSWADFERYPWPNPAGFSTRTLEWYQRNLPEDMCLIGSGGFAHIAEHLTWLMGYETLCYALFDQRDLVAAIVAKLHEMNLHLARLMLQFSRVRVLWGSDDMGFRTGTLISPEDLRQFVLPTHGELATMAHAAGRPYLLHSCGNLDAIMPDLVNQVQIDGKHSFEDAIEDIRDFHRRWGNRTAALGGIDLDLLCRADEATIRRRVREVLEACQPNGRFCLGSGNSVANYVPLESYLAMLDEGRRFA